MASKQHGGRATSGERFYRRLLHLYPREFRDEYENEMTQLYRLPLR